MSFNITSQKIFPRELSQPLSLQWPEDLSSIGVDLETKERIEKIFGEIFPIIQKNPTTTALKACKFPGEGRVLALIKSCWNKKKGAFENKVIKTYSLPLSLAIETTPDGRVNRLFLITKKILGKGATTKVRLCYDMLNGVKYAVKNLLCSYQGDVLNKILKIKTPGVVIPELLGERGSNKTGFIKLKAIEPMYDGTLSERLEREAPFELREQTSLMTQLLHGLSTLHKTPFANITMDTDGVGCCKKQKKIGPFFLHHADIKPANILFRGSGTKNQYSFTDFDGAEPFNLTYTLDYLPPEKLAAVLAVRYSLGNTRFFIAQFNLKKAQKGDIWSLGLVFARVLGGRSSPLPSLKRFYDKIEEPLIKSKQRPIWAKIANLFNYGNIFAPLSDRFAAFTIDQKELDQDIEVLKKESLEQVNLKERPKLEKLWTVTAQMLRVNPDERISADQALLKIS